MNNISSLNNLNNLHNLNCYTGLDVLDWMQKQADRSLGVPPEALEYILREIREDTRMAKEWEAEAEAALDKLGAAEHENEKLRDQVHELSELLERAEGMNTELREQCDELRERLSE